MGKHVSIGGARLSWDLYLLIVIVVVVVTSVAVVVVGVVAVGGRSHGGIH